MIYAPIQLTEAPTPKPAATPTPTEDGCPVRENWNGANFTQIWGALKHCNWHVEAALWSLFGMALLGVFMLVGALCFHRNYKYQRKIFNDQ